MEQLADRGNGNYSYVDTLDEARRVFVENLTGTLQIIARDAKIQVDFDPKVISRYRLLGYENRAVADQDFRNDSVDAGEIGAGHSVTALYEIKFQKDAAAQGRALTVLVRYQDPDTDEVEEVAHDFWRDGFHTKIEDASPFFRFTAAVAEYAEILRQSYWAQDGSLEAVLSLAKSAVAVLDENEALAEYPSLSKDVTEFVWLVTRANELTNGD